MERLRERIGVRFLLIGRMRRGVDEHCGGRHWKIGIGVELDVRRWNRLSSSANAARARVHRGTDRRPLSEALGAFSQPGGKRFIQRRPHRRCLHLPKSAERAGYVSASPVVERQVFGVRNLADETLETRQHLGGLGLGPQLEVGAKAAIRYVGGPEARSDM